jgi:hypothetical protein
LRLTTRQFLSRFFNVFNELVIFMSRPSGAPEHRELAARSQFEALLCCRLNYKLA